MGQEFHVVRCYSCETFQVHQVKKVKKFVCKLCNAKQSVKKEYGRGSGKDCRLHVQKLNSLRQDLEVVKEEKLLQSSINQAGVSEESENEGSFYFGFNRKVNHVTTQDENCTRASKWDTYLEDSTKEEKDDESDDEYVYTTATTGAKKRRGRTNQVKMRKNHKSIHEDEADNFGSSYSQLNPCKETHHFRTDAGHIWQSHKSKPSNSFSCADIPISKSQINDKYSFNDDAKNGHSPLWHKNHEHHINPVVSNTMGRFQDHFIHSEKPYSSSVLPSSSVTRNIQRPGMLNHEKPEKSYDDEILQQKQKVKEKKRQIKSGGVVQASRWNKYVVKEESESEEEEENERAINEMYINRDEEVHEDYVQEVPENGYLLEIEANEGNEFGIIPSHSSEESLGYEASRQSYSNTRDRSFGKSESLSARLVGNQERERPTKRADEQYPGILKAKSDKPPVSLMKNKFLTNRHIVESKYLDLEEDLQLDI